MTRPSFQHSPNLQKLKKNKLLYANYYFYDQNSETNYYYSPSNKLIQEKISQIYPQFLQVIYYIDVSYCENRDKIRENKLKSS